MLTKKENAVMLVLAKLCGWAGKLYIFPGRSKIVKLSKNWFSVQMCERTLTRVLASLSEAGYIGRQRRPLEWCKGGFRSKTSLTFMKWRGLNFLSNLQSLTRGLVITLTERTKTSSNISQTRKSSEPCGKLGSLITQFFQKGGPAGSYSLSQKKFV